MKRYFEMAKHADSIKEFEQMIINLLKESYDSMVQNYIDYYKRVVDRYMSTRKDAKQSPYNWNYMGQMISKYITIKEGSFPHEYIVSPQAPAFMKVSAEKEAKNVQDSYLRRLKEKLWLILESKTIKDITLLQLNLSIFYDAKFKFEFTDDTEFQLTSQIVQSVSKLGKWFYRFPNIYQNITMPDGTKIKKQSEEWMVTQFVGKSVDDAIAKKKSLDPKNAEKELRATNMAIRRNYGVMTKAGEIKPGDKFKIDFRGNDPLNIVSNISDISFSSPFPPLVWNKRQDGSYFYGNMDSDIRGGKGLVATITYKDKTVIKLKVTFVGRGDIFTDSWADKGNEQLHKRAVQFSASTYFNSLSGQVISVDKK